MKLERFLVVLVILAGLLYRWPTLRGPLEYPDWRQTENAYVSWRMMLEPFPDLIHPKVPYRGADDVHINEFPLHAWGVAWLYKLAGGESLLLARLFSLATFGAGTVYLFWLARRWLGSRAAWYAVGVYWSLPLALFYSRAHHYDCMIMSLSFGFLHHALRFFETRRRAHYLGSMLFAICAFLMKAPYCFYFWLPLTYLVLRDTPRPLVFRRLVELGVLGAVPLAAAMMHDVYRVAMDAAYYDKAFLREYYFGTLATRLETGRWLIIARRVAWQVFTPVGLLLAALAPFLPSRPAGVPGWRAVWLTVAGLAAYVLLVFPMVGSTHDYYSIPLLTAAALLIGSVLAWIGEPHGAAPWRGAVRANLLLAAVLACSFWSIRRDHYFSPDWKLLGAGASIAEHTQPDDLVICSTLGRTTGWTDPRMLYYAKRRGWAIMWEELDAAKLETFRAKGARVLAVLITPDREPTFDPARLFGAQAPNLVPLTGPTAQEHLGTLALFDLSLASPQ